MKKTHHTRNRVAIGLVALSAIAAGTVSALAQQAARSVTAADYARGEKMLAPALTGLVVGGSVTPTWLADERFWYRTTLADGTSQTILVDPVRKTRTVCSAGVPDCASVMDAPARQGGAAGR